MPMHLSDEEKEQPEAATDFGAKRQNRGGDSTERRIADEEI